MFHTWICMTCGRRVDEAFALKSIICPDTGCSGPVSRLTADTRDELVTAAERLRRDVKARDKARAAKGLPARFPKGRTP